MFFDNVCSQCNRCGITQAEIYEHVKKDDEPHLQRNSSSPSEYICCVCDCPVSKHFQIPANLQCRENNCKCGMSKEEIG